MFGLLKTTQLVVLSFSLIAITCRAVPTAKYSKLIEGYPYSYPFTEVIAKTQSQAQSLDELKVIKEQEGKRKIASSDSVSPEWFESKMSSEFKKIRDEIYRAIAEVNTKGDENSAGSASPVSSLSLRSSSS